MYFALLALAAAAIVNAQANTTLIPSGISANCSSFLTRLNGDADLASCVQPLITATSSFSPTSGANLTGSDINFTLASICKASSGCDDATVRSWLSNFYSSCQQELTSKDQYNSQVRELYDILYVVNPLQGAVCAIDSANQEYCVNEIIAAEKANATIAAASGVANNTKLSNLAVIGGLSPVTVAAENLYITIATGASSLSKRVINMISSRQAQVQSHATIITPNATTYRNTNLPFLFLNPTMPSKSLCTPCTREVMVAYIKWESRQPYALGLSQSPILGGQSALWTAINSTCGPTYVNAITSEVGSFKTQGTGSTGGAMGMAIPSGVAVAIASMLGFAFLA